MLRVNKNNPCPVCCPKFKGKLVALRSEGIPYVGCPHCKALHVEETYGAYSNWKNITSVYQEKK
jgi:hypothetical protein